MQARVYEYLLKNDAQILICEDDKEASLCADAAEFAGFKAFRLPDFRAHFGDDLRSFSEELFEISSVLSAYYKFNGKKLIISPFHTLLNLCKFLHNNIPLNSLQPTFTIIIFLVNQ